MRLPLVCVSHLIEGILELSDDLVIFRSGLRNKVRHVNGQQTCLPLRFAQFLSFNGAFRYVDRTDSREKTLPCWQLLPSHDQKASGPEGSSGRRVRAQALPSTIITRSSYDPLGCACPSSSHFRTRWRRKV